MRETELGNHPGKRILRNILLQFGLIAVGLHLDIAEDCVSACRHIMRIAGENLSGFHVHAMFKKFAGIPESRIRT